MNRASADLAPPLGLVHLSVIGGLVEASCAPDTTGIPNCVHCDLPCATNEVCTVEGTRVPRPSTVDGGPLDAGRPVPDGGAGTDGGLPDSGFRDGGGFDAGIPDDGGPDSDGGPLECETGQAQLCGSKVAVCTYGTQLCVSGRWGECLAGARPSPEICDGLDNDCNGIVDDRTPPCECLDGHVPACGVSTIGECRMGMQTCIDGRWAPCVGNVDPGSRFCDDRDRDCDGNPDLTQPPCQCRNSETRAFGSSVGVGRQGTQSCVGGQWGACTGGVGPPTTNPSEAAAGLCNGEDDNCDGQSDEGCGYIPPATRSRGPNVGECRPGTQTCQANGTWGTCNDIGPTTGPCDGRDRDCFGVVDGFGPENINLDSPFNQNPYVIAVHYWCDRPGPRFDGESRGNTRATVRLFIDGALVRSWQRTLRLRERWQVADIAWTNSNVPPYVITDRDIVTSSPYGCP